MRYEIKDCLHPWSNLQILATGEVRVCCWSNRELGNINQNSIDKIWNGPLIEELRDYVKNNKIHSICKNAPCPYVQNYLKNENI